MKAPRKHNNVNQNTITGKDNCGSRIGVRSIFALIASQNWNISGDVRTAFLQGKKIERIVYLRPS